MLPLLKFPGVLAYTLNKTVTKKLKSEEDKVP